MATERIRVEIDDASLDEALAKTEKLLAALKGSMPMATGLGAQAARPLLGTTGYGVDASAGSDLLALYQMSSIPGMVERLARGQPTRYDIMRSVHLLSGRVPRLAPLLGLVGPYALVLQLAETIMGPLWELEREQQRPATISDALRKRETDRERFRAWYP